MNGKKENVITENVRRSDRQTLSNCDVLASGGIDTTSNQARNAARGAFLDDTRGNEAARVEARKKAEQNESRRRGEIIANPAQVEEFWRRIDKSEGRKRCWYWNGHKSSYPHSTTMFGKSESVYRLAWKLANKKSIPKGLVIRHTCDNRGCVNPFHLLIGTQKDNHNDMVSRGRQRY